MEQALVAAVVLVVAFGICDWSWYMFHQLTVVVSAERGLPRRGLLPRVGQLSRGRGRRIEDTSGARGHREPKRPHTTVKRADPDLDDSRVTRWQAQ